MKMLKSKKGEEKLLSIWWFFVIIIVAVGIAIGVYIFYSASIDIRQTESEILSSRIFDCLVKQGVLIDDALKSDFDIYKQCNFNEDSFKDTFYLNITIFGGGQETISYEESNVDDAGDATSAVNSDFNRVREVILNVSKKGKCACGNECGNYASYIINAATKYKIDDSLLLLAIMIQESGCNANADSGSSVGLMQINRIHCGRYGLPKDKTECVNKLKTDAELNINVGAQILKAGYNTGSKKYKCDASTKTNQEAIDVSYSGWDRALRAYNGWACSGADYFYVEKINKIFADLKKTINEEVPVGGTGGDIKKKISARVKVNEIISKSTISFQKDCEIQLGGVVSKNLAQCSEKEESVVYGDGKAGFLHVMTASDNKGRRVLK